MGSGISSDAGNSSGNQSVKPSFVPSKPAGPAFASTVNTPPPTVIPVALPVTVEYRPAPEIKQPNLDAAKSSSPPSTIPSPLSSQSSSSSAASVASDTSSYTSAESDAQSLVTRAQQLLEQHTSTVDKLQITHSPNATVPIESLQHALGNLQKSREIVTNDEFSLNELIFNVKQRLVSLEKLQQAAETLRQNQTQISSKQRELDLSQSHLDRVRTVLATMQSSSASSASSAPSSFESQPNSSSSISSASEKEIEKQQQMEYQVHVSTRAIATLSKEIEALQSQRTLLLKEPLADEAAATSSEVIAQRIHLAQAHHEVLQHMVEQELRPIIPAFERLSQQLQKAIDQHKSASSSR